MRQLLPDGQRQGPAQKAGAENGDGGEKKLLSGIFSHGFTGKYISAPEHRHVQGRGVISEVGVPQHRPGGIRLIGAPVQNLDLLGTVIRADHHRGIRRRPRHRDGRRSGRFHRPGGGNAGTGGVTHGIRNDGLGNNGSRRRDIVGPAHHIADGSGIGPGGIRVKPGILPGHRVQRIFTLNIIQQAIALGAHSAGRIDIFRRINADGAFIHALRFTGRQKNCTCGQQHAYRRGSIHIISLRVIAFCQHPTVPQPHVNHKACLPNLFMTRNLRLPSPHAGKAARTNALAAFLLPAGSAGTALDGLKKRRAATESGTKTEQPSLLINKRSNKYSCRSLIRKKPELHPVRQREETLPSRTCRAGLRPSPARPLQKPEKRFPLFPGTRLYGNRLSFPTPHDLLQSAPHG